MDLWITAGRSRVARAMEKGNGAGACSRLRRRRSSSRREWWCGFLQACRTLYARSVERRWCIWCSRNTFPATRRRPRRPEAGLTACWIANHSPLTRSTMFRGALALLSPRDAVFSLALAASPLLAQTPAGAVRVSGSVLDSLTHAPLAAASVHFARVDDPGSGSFVTGTDAAGRFDISLSPGRWLVGIEHPHLDSLGVTLPARRVDIPVKPSFRLQLATASARTLTQAYCGARARDDDAVIVGIVQ